jgi:uncharacterized protein
MADALTRMRAKRAARRVSQVTPYRSCAGCDLCCTAPGIAELHKPPGERCAHLAGPAGRSCSIYASRPTVCIDFHCLWRTTDQILPDWLRPADCGFLLAFNNPSVWPSVVTVHVDPERPKAWENPWAQTVFATLAEQWNCLVAIGQAPGTSHIFCPNGTKITVANYAPAEQALIVKPDGFIGAPAWAFGPDRRPVVERIREVGFSWGLPPPPVDLWNAQPLHDREQREQ